VLKYMESKFWRTLPHAPAMARFLNLPTACASTALNSLASSTISTHRRKHPTIA